MNTQCSQRFKMTYNKRRLTYLTFTTFCAYMLPIALATHSFNRFGVFDTGFEKVARFAARAGFGSLELTETLTSRFYGGARHKDIARHYSLTITTVHQSLAHLIWAPLRSIDNTARRAQELGAKVVVVHLGAIRSSFADPSFFSAIKKIEKKYDVMVALENAMLQFGFLRRGARAAAQEPDGFASVISRHNLSATYDIGHMAAKMSDPVSYIERIRQNLRHLHIHDVRGAIDHQPLGTGSLPIASLLRHLVDTKFSGSVTLEVFPYNIHPFMSRQRVEEIIRQSMGYIKEALAGKG